MCAQVLRRAVFFAQFSGGVAGFLQGVGLDRALGGCGFRADVRGAWLRVRLDRALSLPSGVRGVWLLVRRRRFAGREVRRIVVGGLVFRKGTNEGWWFAFRSICMILIGGEVGSLSRRF